MVRLLTIMLLCCMAALSATQKPTDASFVTISGMVKDKDSKKGIPGGEHFIRRWKTG